MPKAPCSAPPSQGDAFDGAAIIQVDGGSIILPGGESATVDREGQTITGGPVTLSGLNVTVQYHALTSSATLRVLASFQNPTGAPISATASFLSNLGSDSDTVARGTGSGDTGVTAADRWVVTDDDRDTGGDPDVTHVFFGPGRPRVAPDVIVLLQTEALFAPYRITAPANQTRRLLFFIQLNQTHTQALANAAAFDTNPAPRSDLLNGLSEAQLAEVLNFRFAGNLPPTVSDIPNQTTPEDTPTGPISFTVGDEETPAGSLSVTATTRSWAATASTSSRATT